MTRESQAPWHKAERTALRSPMWAVRRDPARWTAAEPQAWAWACRFEKIPQRNEWSRAPSPVPGALGHGPEAHPGGAPVEATPPRDRALGVGPRSVVATSARWTTAIGHAGAAPPTSAAVAGLTNEARVIPRRTYGWKSADGLGKRLLLDLNRASEAIGWSIEQILPIALLF